MIQQECLKILDAFGTSQYDEETVEECKNMLRTAMFAVADIKVAKGQQSFKVGTPKGTIVAKESLEVENPGIYLLCFDENGKEHSSCVMHYMEEDESLMARIWGPNDPDGDPIISLHVN